MFYKEDIQTMADLGLNSFRFSISWPRVIPAEGTVNPLGIDFYNRVIDECLKHGIEPIITICHGDMPLWIFEKGGWVSENIASDFAFFAKVCVENFSDRVRYFITMNEPQNFAGDFLGILKDQKELPASVPQDVTMGQITRGILLAHGAAVDSMRAAARQEIQIGMDIMGVFVEPVPGAVDEETAYQMTWSTLAGSYGMAWWLDPILEGTVCEELKPYITEEDLGRIGRKMDFFGVNAYSMANYMARPGRKNPLAYPGMDKSLVGMPVRDKVLYYVVGSVEIYCCVSNDCLL